MKDQNNLEKVSSIIFSAFLCIVNFFKLKAKQIFSLIKSYAIFESYWTIGLLGGADCIIPSPHYPPPP